MIIGVTGPIAAGKGAVVRYLKSKGFDSFSLSDVLRDECVKKHLEVTRENLQKMGEDLRKKFGKGILAQRILEKVTKNAVVESIRKPEEVEVLKKASQFHLIGVSAPLKLRYERLVKRAREEDKDKLSYNNFLEISKNAAEQEIEKCIRMADFVIENDCSIEELNNKVENIISSLKDKRQV